jgi:hypothetical protein
MSEFANSSEVLGLLSTFPWVRRQLESIQGLAAVSYIAGSAIVVQLPLFTNLRVLNANFGTWRDEDDTVMLQAIAKLRSLEHLGIRGILTSHAETTMVSTVQSLPNLNTLMLTGDWVTTRSLHRLLHGIQSNLMRLIITASRTLESLDWLADAPHIQQTLKTLVVIPFNARTEDVTPFIKCTQLRMLELHSSIELHLHPALVMLTRVRPDIDLRVATVELPHEARAREYQAEPRINRGEAREYACRCGGHHPYGSSASATAAHQPYATHHDYSSDDDNSGEDDSEDEEEKEEEEEATTNGNGSINSMDEVD